MAFKIQTIPKVTVSQAGTAVRVSATAVRAVGIMILASASNTGNVYIGDSTVDATNGMPVPPRGAWGMDSFHSKTWNNEIFFLDEIWVNSSTSGNSVLVLAQVIRT